MEITFGLPHVFERDSDSLENAKALRLLLEALITLNLAYLQHHSAPALYQSGVVYRRTRTWDSIPEVLRKGFADCKSLSAYLIAQYRQKGVRAEPVFRFMPVKNGNMFHILVKTDKGFEDPSKVLGMRVE